MYFEYTLSRPVKPCLYVFFSAGPSNSKKVKVEERKRVKLIDCSVWRVPMYTIVTLTGVVAFLSEVNPQIHMVRIIDYYTL